MLQFLGNMEARADAKGRIFVPAIFVKRLQSAGEEFFGASERYFSGLFGIISRECLGKGN